MSTPQEAIDVIAEELGIKTAVLFRFARALKEARGADGRRRDLWPVSGLGGGKSAAHVQGFHLASLILSLFASQPADVVAMVDTLRGWLKGPNLSSSGANLPDSDRGYSTLGEFVHLPIEALARADNSTREAWAADMAEIRLCVDVDGGLAFLMDGKTRQFYNDHEVFFAPGKNPFEEQVNRVRRIVEIPFALVVVAADLLADTLARSGGLDFPPSAAAQTMASAGNENAPDPGRSEAPTRSTDRLRDNGHRTLTTRKTKPEMAKSQALSSSRWRSALSSLQRFEEHSAT